MKRLRIGGLVLLLCSVLAPMAATSAGAAAAPTDCHPNYTPCVPVAEDVDCAGGDGDGPAYVEGPVTVVGEDLYGLDHDGNGTGCESDDPAPTPTTTPTSTTTTTTAPPSAPAPPPAQPVVEQPDFTG
jgi:hypothetical protein